MSERTDIEDKELRKLVIIGSGPAGLSAAIYAGRAELNPLVITGNEVGGKLSTTLSIDNYPGYLDTDAVELIKKIQKQAINFGAQIENELVTEVDVSELPFSVKTDRKEYLAKSVIICTGSSARKLKVPGEKEFVGKGVSYCGTCDGFFFRDKSIVVVGGGNTAVEEAIFLTRFASEVNIVHRRDRLRANEVYQKRAFQNEKISFIWNSVVEEILGDDVVNAVRLRNVKTDETQEFPTDGVFIFIGHEPNTQLFSGQLELDERGYIITDKHQHTSVHGVFAAGDVQDKQFRQAIISAGTGAVAAIEAERYVAEMEDRAYPY